MQVQSAGVRRGRSMSEVGRDWFAKRFLSEAALVIAISQLREQHKSFPGPMAALRCVPCSFFILVF